MAKTRVFKENVSKPTECPFNLVICEDEDPRFLRLQYSGTSGYFRISKKRAPKIAEFILELCK